jgi:hypothetical protein
VSCDSRSTRHLAAGNEVPVEVVRPCAPLSQIPPRSDRGGLDQWTTLQFGACNEPVQAVQLLADCRAASLKVEEEGRFLRLHLFYSY